ncbi:2'-5' RNA ligase family protein [Mucilaginibacter sp. PAMB04274]|uniref:2'-5' RNA ligase family protein n=1 Tax=Mucilaginibacter sp. PAMB04274 TaxID=3138568 RepID=UPI0031F6842D
MSDTPLILTLTLDEDSQQYFNELRREHFPPERNYLNAHLTLFHHLPSDRDQIFSDILLAVKTYQIMQLAVTEIKSIGSGVAFKIESTPLMQLHRYLQQLWQPWLTPQDKQTLWPHITIQNKVEPNQAMLLEAQLEQDFKPFTARGLGLSVHEYQGGPWKFKKSFEFGTN